jgi:hypothetical protein
VATWVHVFEEDEAGREVYRPEEGQIPLSRRPRERVQLRADGTSSVFLPGPDDRFIERRATWTEQSGRIVIRVEDETRTELVVVERSPSRMVIERRRATDKG